MFCRFSLMSLMLLLVCRNQHLVIWWLMSVKIFCSLQRRNWSSLKKELLCSVVTKEAGILDVTSIQISSKLAGKCCDLKRKPVASWRANLPTVLDGLLVSAGGKPGFDGSPRKSIVATERWWQLHQFRTTHFLCCSKEFSKIRNYQSIIKSGYLMEHLCETIELQRGFFCPSPLK